MLIITTKNGLNATLECFNKDYSGVRFYGCELCNRRFECFSSLDIYLSIDKELHIGDVIKPHDYIPYLFGSLSERLR